LLHRKYQGQISLGGAHRKSLGGQIAFIQRYVYFQAVALDVRLASAIPVTQPVPESPLAALTLCRAYEMLARRGEFVALELKDIDLRPDGTGQALIARGKTEAEGEGRQAYFSRETVRWLKV
jgi:hypothetical protein